MNGFINLHRQLLKWEWYQNINTKVVFIHCLLKANWEDGKFEGQTIPRGSFVTGRKQLAKELLMTEQQIRTALEHLKTTNEITIKTTNKFSIITVVNYEKYNQKKDMTTNKITNEQPTTNQQLTNNQPQMKKNNKNKKEKKDNKEIYKEILSEIAFKNITYDEELQQVIGEWLEYKEQKKDNYEKKGLQKLLTQIDKKCTEYGASSVIDVINDSMASNYVGIIFNKLGEQKNQNKGKKSFAEMLQEEMKNEQNRNN